MPKPKPQPSNRALAGAAFARALAAGDITEAERKVLRDAYNAVREVFNNTEDSRSAELWDRFVAQLFVDVFLLDDACNIDAAALAGVLNAVDAG